MADKKLRITPYPWIKLYAPKLLHGTMAGESPEHIGIFIKLLCLANESGYRDGRLFTPPNIPMSRNYIATILQVPLDMLNEAIEYFKGEVNQDPASPHYGTARIQELDGGMLMITNFADYQAKEDDKGEQREKKEDIPLSPEAQDARGRYLAEKQAFKYPKEAARGIRNRQIEDGIRGTWNKLNKLTEGDKELLQQQGVNNDK
jgi:hypothetical protein